MESLTDDSVDTFYSCLLCQSFAPSHVCVITPERLGLCGAYNWLDGKAAYEIDPTGGNQPLLKGECIDPVRGQWENINKYVYANSKQAIENVNAYSMMENPMTSCGCFEAVVALLPECNGVMIVQPRVYGRDPGRDEVLNSRLNRGWRAADTQASSASERPTLPAASSSPPKAVINELSGCRPA